jgi:hypothetical protein
MPFAGHGKDAEDLSYIDVMNPFAFVSTGFNGSRPAVTTTCIALRSDTATSPPELGLGTTVKTSKITAVDFFDDLGRATVGNPRRQLCGRADAPEARPWTEDRSETKTRKAGIQPADESLINRRL